MSRGAPGKVKIARRRPIHGVGINDSDYAIVDRSSGKSYICPYYARWAEMLRRCYSESHKEKNPTYKECSCVLEWHRFSEFRKWMIDQDWHGKNLDKDILYPGNLIYGPETCIFVSPEINRLLEDSRASRGDFPIGVHLNKRKGKFVAKFRANGKSNELGYFDCPEKANEAYRLAKSSHVMQVAMKQDDERLRLALINWSKLIETGEAHALK